MKNWCRMVVMSLVGYACSTGVRTTPSGLEYKLIKEGKNDVAPDGSYLVLNMSYQDENDSVWVNTVEEGFPMLILKQDSIWRRRRGTLEEVFSDLRKGDSVQFAVTARQLYVQTWRRPLPPEIPGGMKITFFVGVSDVLDKQGAGEYQYALSLKTRKKELKEQRQRIEEEGKLIDQYLEKNGLTAETTDSGLRYRILEPGQGDFPVIGQKVKVAYVGRVLGGPYFDTSDKKLAEELGIYNPGREPYKPFEFVVGTREVIRGWDEGVMRLKVGGKATLYIPSPLAYGASEKSKEIKANSILIFELSLLEILE